MAVKPLYDKAWCWALVFSLFFFSASEYEVFPLKIFPLKWIFVLACSFRQTSKHHSLLWLTDGDDELDDESPNAKNIAG